MYYNVKILFWDLCDGGSNNGGDSCELDSYLLVPILIIYVFSDGVICFQSGLKPSMYVWNGLTEITYMQVEL